MFTVISHFKVMPGWREKVEQAFLNRPHLVEQADGFIRIDVLQKQDDPDQFWLYTQWRDETSYEIWHKSHQYQESHSHIPEGLKLQGAFTDIKKFTHLCS
ncbi:MAG: antibiotic biosynthesis monooxygenase [Magnetococcales bacterium]|nr:antibiotic biosynthesis monooxygenase [Magnetococcales bacterium]